jgi:hypothetical protein
MKFRFHKWKLIVVFIIFLFYEETELNFFPKSWLTLQSISVLSIQLSLLDWYFFFSEVLSKENIGSHLKRTSHCETNRWRLVSAKLFQTLAWQVAEKGNRYQLTRKMNVHAAGRLQMNRARREFEKVKKNHKSIYAKKDKWTFTAFPLVVGITSTAEIVEQNRSVLSWAWRWIKRKVHFNS